MERTAVVIALVGIISEQLTKIKWKKGTFAFVGLGLWVF